MTDKELLQMALDALEAHADIGINATKQIEALRARLENGIALTAAMHPVSLGPPSECKVSKESLEEVVLEKWVGLTDEEIEGAIDEGFAFGLDDGNVSNKYVIRYVRVIEAMLKEKNNV